MADLKEKTYVEDVDRSVYDIRDAENDAYRMESGLTPEIVEKLSKEKDDPVWIQQFRLESQMCIRDRISTTTTGTGRSSTGLSQNSAETVERISSYTSPPTLPPE